jgi:hypothetical protein
MALVTGSESEENVTVGTERSQVFCGAGIAELFDT